MLFVTGTGRSGTSLADKLLSIHPAIRILSQPLPSIYVEIKREFARMTGTDICRHFPLGDLFGDNYAPPQELTRFLREWRLEPDWIAATLHKMEGFDGRYTMPPPETAGLIPAVSVPLVDFVGHYLSTLVREPCPIVGSKEVFAEEFIPYLLGANSKILLLIRHPCDVVASTYLGRGPEFAGQGRPVLFTLRQWRKSAAFALDLHGEPDLKVIRYEDLVARPLAVLNTVAAWLDLPPFPPDLGSLKLKTDNGEAWLANSSHEAYAHISTRSVGRHKELLSSAQIKAIEMLCGPEMVALGYSDCAETGAGLDSIDGGALDLLCPEPRAALQGYIWSERSRDQEKARLQGLAAGHFRPDLHLYSRAFERLAG